MKTLAELLHDEMVRNGYFGANGRDDEAIAGLVGAVGEWLAQDGMAWVIPDAQTRQALRGALGRGLDA